VTRSTSKLENVAATGEIKVVENPAVPWVVIGAEAAVKLSANIQV
jgi:hypothetical protein